MATRNKYVDYSEPCIHAVVWSKRFAQISFGWRKVQLRLHSLGPSRFSIWHPGDFISPKGSGTSLWVAKLFPSLNQINGAKQRTTDSDLLAPKVNQMTFLKTFRYSNVLLEFGESNGNSKGILNCSRHSIRKFIQFKNCIVINATNLTPWAVWSCFE